MIDLAALSASVAGAARGNAPIQVQGFVGQSPELLRRLALLRVLVRVAARRQQQQLRAPSAGVLRAPGSAALSDPTLTVRDLRVQKIAAAVLTGPGQTPGPRWLSTRP